MGYLSLPALQKTFGIKWDYRAELRTKMSHKLRLYNLHDSFNSNVVSHKTETPILSNNVQRLHTISENKNKSF
jgi:hypothetical protein